MADGALGWPAVPVPQLVGATARFPFPHTDPDGFATSAEIVDFLSAYADFIAAPVRCGVTVTALLRRPGASGFLAETSDGPIEAGNVVVATGPYQRPIVPALLPEDAGVFQVHASTYREPDQLPAGAVLIVGSGASGAQIAEELLRAGRPVYLRSGITVECRADIADEN